VGATEREEWGYDRGSARSVAAKAGLSEDVREGGGFEGVLELRRMCEFLKFFFSGLVEWVLLCDDYAAVVWGVNLVGGDGVLVLYSDLCQNLLFLKSSLGVGIFL